MQSLRNSDFLSFVRITSFILFYGTLFALLCYYTLASLPEINQDILEFLKALIYKEDSETDIGSRITLGLNIFNILLFFLLAVFSFSMFSSGLSGLFYVISAKKYGYEEINLLQAIKRITEWQLYKYFLVILPLLGFITVAGVLFLLSVLFFNAIVTGIGLFTGISFFIMSFIFFNLMFFLSLSILGVLWKSINLVFGTEIAVSEPQLDNLKISLRSERLIRAARSNFLLLFIYVVFGFLLMIQLIYLDILNIGIFSVFFTFNALGYAGIKYLKANAYIKSLLNYSEKITA